MNTRQLLALRNRLLGLEDSVEGSDMYAAEIAALDPELIYFKSDARWQLLYDAVKSVRSRREHMPRR